MQQYDKSAPKPTSVDRPIDDPVSGLMQQIQQQNRKIEAIETQVRRLKNELRAAINAYNQHGR